MDVLKVLEEKRLSEADFFLEKKQDSINFIERLIK